MVVLITNCSSFYVILDADRGILAYATADLFIGCLFTRLRDGFGSAVLYPMISTVVNHSEVTIRYVGGLTRKLLNSFYAIPLMHMFRINSSGYLPY